MDYNKEIVTMPAKAKIKKGGNKAKKQKNNPVQKSERRLELRDPLEFQEYGQVMKAYGNGRYETECFDGKSRLSHARGNLKKKKVFVKVGDVIVVSLREFEDNKCDIIYVYNIKEVKLLKKIGEIPLTVVEDMNVNNEESDDGIDFEEEEEEEPKQTIEPIDIDSI